MYSPAQNLKAAAAGAGMQGWSSAVCWRGEWSDDAGAQECLVLWTGMMPLRLKLDMVRGWNMDRWRRHEDDLVFDSSDLWLKCQHNREYNKF